ncbi:MAG: hypothetical protein ACRCWF_04515 [Beijerinckiaceae bacterium]
MRLIALLASVMFVSACTQTAAPPAAPVQRTSASFVTPSNFRLPEGQGCSGDIARFRAVQENDLETGHVNQSVYNRIKGEIDQAASLCAAGNDAGARGALSAVKKRHGYPG